MDEEIFKKRYFQILIETENTNYGSVKSQLNMLLLIQEVYLKKALPKEVIINLCREAYGAIENMTEAQLEAGGEIISNLENAHKCDSVFTDLGLSYVNYLFQIVQFSVGNNSLFKECNT
jgi:hypothetical protein